LNPVAAGDAGVWNVTITDDNGCETTGSTTVTVNAPPTVTPTANMPCDGQQALMLTSTPAGGSGMYTGFNWSGPTGQSSTDQDPVITPGTNANDEGMWDVTVTDSNGCTGTGSVMVTVNDLPAAPAGTGDIACQNTVVNAGLSATGCTNTSWYDAAVGGNLEGTGTQKLYLQFPQSLV